MVKQPQKQEKPQAEQPIAPPAASPPTKTEPEPGLRITAKRTGFRRAGRAWPATPTDVRLADLTEEQIDALKTEPRLLVEVIEVQG